MTSQLLSGKRTNRVGRDACSGVAGPAALFARSRSLPEVVVNFSQGAGATAFLVWPTTCPACSNKPPRLHDFHDTPLVYSLGGRGRVGKKRWGVYPIGSSLYHWIQTGDWLESSALGNAENLQAGPELGRLSLMEVASLRWNERRFCGFSKNCSLPRPRGLQPIQKRFWVVITRFAERQPFDQIEPPLSALALRDIGLRLPQFLGELILR